MSEKPTYEELEQKIDALEAEIFEMGTSEFLDKDDIDEKDQDASISYKALVDALPGIGMLVNAGHEIVESNQAGLDVGALPGRRCFQIWGQQDSPCPWCRKPEALSGQQMESVDTRVAGKQWRVAWLPLGEELSLHVILEITEDKHREDLLKHEEKRMALGTITRGISNDVNNIMTGIKGYISLMLKDLETSHPYREHLKALAAYTTQAESLTQQLLEFASAGNYDFRPMDLNETVEKYLPILEQSEEIQAVHPQYEEYLWQIEADKNAIGRALKHICDYAQQTMPGGGELFLQTKNVTLDEADVEPYDTVPGKYVCLAITDSGIGLDDSIREKIFDPFFITEEMGWKLGLGVSSANGIIRSHGGFLEIESVIMEGTTYNLYLPVVRAKQEQRSTLASRERTILLVDDQAVIVEVGNQMIRDLGYHCLIAKSGQEALALYRAHQSRIDLTILDMILPEMAGTAIFDHLKKVNPQAKILLTSGYGMTDQVKDLLSQGGSGYIQKPFDITELSDKIDGVLQG